MLKFPQTEQLVKWPMMAFLGRPNMITIETCSIKSNSVSVNEATLGHMLQIQNFHLSHTISAISNEPKYKRPKFK